MTELHRDGLHEAVRLDGRLGGIMECGATLFGIFKEGLQAGDSLRRGALEVDLVGCEGGENLHLIAGAGNSHVQTSPSAFPVERAEGHGDPPILVLAVADREEDHIPLVALHILQVLDEDRFLGGHRQLFQIGPFGEKVREQVLNEGLLVGVESHHADAAPTEVGILQTTADLGDDGLGFRPVLPRSLLSPVVDAIHMFIGQFGIQIIRRGERKERVLVELGVAEGDKAFMLAPIVPAEMFGGEGKGKAVIEDAVQVLHLGVIFVKGILVEEIGRRHLLLIADHDDALAAGDGAHRLAGRHLGSLVEDDKVELRSLGFGVGHHRERAHKHARAHPGQQVRDHVEEPAERDAPASVTDVPLQDAHFRGLRRLRLQGRQLGGEPGEQFIPGERLEVLAQPAEPGDLLLEHRPVEQVQRRLLG